MNTNTPQPASIEPAAVVSKDHIDEELQRYDAYLRDLRGLSPGSRSSCLRVAHRLLRQKFGNGAVDIARLRPADVRQFLADQLEARRTPSNASTLASGLRSYFRYRSTCGDPADRLTAVISSPAHWNLASLPHALTGEEVERLLDSFRFARRWPKRGYAIVRCALDLGLRAGEIARLTISDIDWHAGTVTLRGTKSFRQDILPLPIETGQALADYLLRIPTNVTACTDERDRWGLRAKRGVQILTALVTMTLDSRPDADLSTGGRQRASYAGGRAPVGKASRAHGLMPFPFFSSTRP
ncbi:probable integrase (plasmid) [Aromatoleum aromaticum EbN1]|uniref:Probable integrase n=1 Tax=Aromatoleum aromaticum (strain DSM 19018 / LMG 30748 / EbN1) TaxID=76114 RepID=Q5NWF0_AROAE|nr:tyrosine-type recombinase/integrase [Aromatoleum aromaticum]CAI10614.1 probable integrase [Aromatoleum aromaticum EbN1]